MSWHNRDPVLSVDIQPKSKTNANLDKFIRLASGGSDAHVIVSHSFQYTTSTLSFAVAQSRFHRFGTLCGRRTVQCSWNWQQI